jgi:aminoglycoside phosphotransferase (APT) family kinase protein
VRALFAASVLVALFVPGALGGAAPGTSLSVSLWREGRAAGDALTFTLRCRPTGGDLPRAARACAALAQLRDPFRPVPADAVCTQQYGGPSEAFVVGRFEGRRIWTRFNRRDGCHISRWQKHSFLFPIRPASP